MTGFELQTSGIGSDRSTNCATTTVLSLIVALKLQVMASLNMRTNQTTDWPT